MSNADQAPQHVKITDHFARQAEERLPKRDVMALWTAILDGRFGRAVLKLRRGERAVAAIGTSYVVFMRDEQDPGEVALMTVLDPNTAAGLNRRRDTRLVDLGVGRRVSIKTDAAIGTFAMFGRDLEGNEAVKVIGGAGEGQGFELEMSLEEAEELYDSLGRIIRGA